MRTYLVPILLLTTIVGLSAGAEAASTHVLGANKQTLSPSTDTVNAGYYSPTALHVVDANLAAGNIKNGVTIFGIMGTYIAPPSTPTAGGEWVLVPGNLAFGTTDFYVMKYEAKSVGGVATSQADVTPWANINQTNAIAACSALGDGYHLLTIPEVQTINRNIEAQTANWANGTIGSLVSDGGGLKRGNVGITDSASYDGADPEFGTSRDVKGTHVLSNGGILWDWSGNVREWVYGAGANGTQGTPGGVTFDTGGTYEWNNAVLNEERPVLGPSNSSYTRLHGVGVYYGGGATTNAVTWGGGWADGAFAGVFAFFAYTVPSYWTVDFGFRCGR
ncbi:MAG: hypothetical protein Q7R35_19820 [Elusimicrobiota bacterium]|nr:hypothetical protein [Elusimicrobiota bacterium]